MNTMFYLHRAFISLCGGAPAPPHPRGGPSAPHTPAWVIWRIIQLTSQVDYKLDERSTVTPGGGVGAFGPPPLI